MTRYEWTILIWSALIVVGLAIWYAIKTAENDDYDDWDYYE